MYNVGGRGARAGTVTTAAGVLIALLAHVGPARAQGGLSLDDVEVHGFGSQGFVLTTGNEYLVTDSKRGSFQLSEVGINFNKELTDRLRFGVQFVAQNFGPAGNYTPKIDWFNLDFRARDWVGLRAGRLKIPLGLYNEINDVDAARVPALLPQSVYPLQARSFLFAQTGGEIYGFLRSEGAGALEYRIYGGTIFIDPALVIAPGTPVDLRFNVPFAVGGRLAWETPLPGLRLAASVLKLRLDTVAFLPMGMRAEIINNSIIGIASLEWTWQDLVVAIEYNRGHTKQDTVIVSSQIDRVGDSGYVLGSWAVTPWLATAVHFAVQYPDVEQRQGLSHKQRDLGLTLRFDVNPHWLIKLEGHYMAGTAGLTNPLRVTGPPQNPARHWAVFLARTTVTF